MSLALGHLGQCATPLAAEGGPPLAWVGHSAHQLTETVNVKGALFKLGTHISSLKDVPLEEEPVVDSTWNQIVLALEHACQFDQLVHAT
jgi:hypothetical protein